MENEKPKTPYELGKENCQNMGDPDENPFPKDSAEYKQWENGWNDMWDIRNVYDEDNFTEDEDKK